MNRFKTFLAVPAFTLALALAPLAIAKGSDSAIENRSATGTEMTSENRSALGPALKAILTSGNNKDKDVAVEVRNVIEEHASTAERADRKKNEVESRHGWLVFLIGSDYKNLGALRSELVTTQNEISRLEKARDRATDPAVKAEISVQITELQKIASDTESFLKTHENKFSLLGWFFRIFSK